MPHLLNFANETLDQIIAATSPHDIESLAASCRTINTLAKPKVKRHHELKRKYARLAFRDCGYSDNTPGVHPIYLLRDVLHDTAVAQYPTTIRSTALINDSFEWLDIDRDLPELKDIRAVAVGCEKDIENAIYECAFIEIPERENWEKQIMQGSGEVMFGLLLTLLPHLTSMVILEQPEGLFMQMLQRIVELQQPHHRHAPQALTKLARVDTTPCYSMYHMGPASKLDSFSQYALLPSMRTITGSHFQLWNALDFQWRHNPGISAVTEINIHCSMIHGEIIINLLRGVRALERFSFASSSYNYWTPINQPRKIINGLKQYAKCSLSYLRLTSFRIGMITVEVDDVEYDLRGFEKLKRLHIDHTLLSHHDRPCLAPSSGKPSHYSGESDRECDCWPQRLVDVLPASLESVKLVGSVPRKRVKAFFAGFSELKAERLPRLREIEMWGSAAAELQFVHLCKKVGVVLSQNVDKDDVHYHCS